MKPILPKNYIAGIFVIWILVLCSCEKDDKYPEIQTGPLVEISNGSYIASAKVISRGENKITDHGFIYYLNSELPSQGSYYPTNLKISLGNKIESDTFAAAFTVENIGYGYDNLKCIVRAYITDERGTVYANYVFKPILRLQVSGVVPQAGKAGDTISITGSNFTAEPSANSVKFGNVSAEILSASSNELKVVVPEGVIGDYWDSYVTIQVISAGQTASISYVFRLAASATGFQPGSGRLGDMITIYGSGFRNCTVFFNYVQVDYYNSSSGYITVYIPYDLQLKKFKINILSYGVMTEVPGGDFTIITP